MTTLISKESLLGKLEQLPPDQFYNIASIRNFIKAEEEAVTRCKDCKIRYTNNCGMFDVDSESEWTGDLCFCNWGERKDGR